MAERTENVSINHTCQTQVEKNPRVKTHFSLQELLQSYRELM